MWEVFPMNPYRHHAEQAPKVLKNQRLRVSPLTTHDIDALIALVDRCSPESRFLRFHTGMAALRPSMAEQLVDVDNGLALGVRSRRGRLIAEGRYTITGDATAEVAALVADDYQGRGVGRALLALLFTHAADNGVRSLHAEVLPSNDAIVKVLGGLAPIDTLGVRDGVRELCMPLGEAPCPQCAQDLSAA
jgi:GNAT superfamily N-acetyltransferase